MKKFLFVFLVLLILTACKDEAPKKEEKKEVDQEQLLKDSLLIGHPYKYGSVWLFLHNPTMYHTGESDDWYDAYYTTDVPKASDVVYFSSGLNLKSDKINIIILDSERIYFGNLEESIINNISKYKEELLSLGNKYTYTEEKATKYGGSETAVSVHVFNIYHAGQASFEEAKSHMFGWASSFDYVFKNDGKVYSPYMHVYADYYHFEEQYFYCIDRLVN